MITHDNMTRFLCIENSTLSVRNADVSFLDSLQDEMDLNPRAVADVTSKFINILKLRRKTMAPQSQSDGSTRQRFLSCSERSVGANSNDTHSSRQSKRLSFRGISRTFSTLLRLRLNNEPAKPEPEFENNYKMKPDSAKRFKSDDVKTIAYKVMERELNEMEYSQVCGGRTACRLAADIKDTIKTLDMPRYRLICQVVITQTFGQGMEASSKFLWDDKNDNLTCVTYKSKDIVAVAMIYGVYLE